MAKEFFSQRPSVTPTTLPSSEQDFLNDIKTIISSGQQSAASAVNRAAVLTYWSVGKRIIEQEQSGSERADYAAFGKMFHGGFSKQQFRS